MREKLTDALGQVEGAYSLVVLTDQGLIACRDPLGIRPLVMGKLGEATIFASETVALDVIGATFLRDVEPGEMVIVNDSGIRSFRPFPKADPQAVHLRACLFLAPRQHRRGPVGLRSAQAHRRRAVPGSAGRGRLCRPRPRQRRARGDRLQPGLGHSRSSSGSSARTMSGGPSSSRARKCATSASS